VFELNKLLGAGVAPVTLCLELGVASLVCAGYGRLRWAWRLTLLGTLLLWLAATPLVAASLAGALERQHPPVRPDAAQRADAILILGGALARSGSAQINMGAAADRIWHAAALYRAGKAGWVIVAAGGRAIAEDGRVEADAIGEMLATLGVPAAAIRTERASRNTQENAQLVRPLVVQLQVRRVLLVTSAVHMPRALKTFRQVSPDIDWIPAATDAEVSARDVSLLIDLFPSAAALERTTRAIKEYAGLLAPEI
jgi:uncharacterized SAM-binding protein YcdF (DUF218 family)